jgi:hypothetical protein
MKTAGRFVVVGWLLLALVLLGMDGQLPVFLAWTAPATLLALTVGALVRQQRAPSMLYRPQLPSPIGSPTTSGNHSALWSPQRKPKPPPGGRSHIVGQEPGRQSSVRRRPAAGPAGAAPAPPSWCFWSNEAAWGCPGLTDRADGSVRLPAR